MAAKNHGERADVFGQTDAADFDQAMFKPSNAASDLPDPRIVAHLTDIDRVWADARQPRRAVPASIRMHWNGSPEDVQALLAQWHMIACKRAGVDLNIVDVLMGRGEGIDAPEDAPVIFREYVALLRLAQSIYADGLINPISVIEQRGRFLIESGERRWLAYHLLHLNMGTMDWGKIPAVRSDGRDFVWRQAQENTARRQLNAIGMARQLALLIMETRAHLDGVKYDDFEDAVQNGVCDRRFYAQVSNGNVHRIPKGMGERIQGAMGLSEKRLSDYRNLLKLTDDELVNDALWVRADVEDWAEQPMRAIATLPIGKVREVVLGAGEWTLEDLRRLAITPIPGPSPASMGREQAGPQFYAGDRVMIAGLGLGTVIGQRDRVVTVKPDVDGRQRSAHAVDLELIDRKQAPPPPVEDDVTQMPKFTVGEAVEIKHTGEIGEVLGAWRGANGREVALNVDGAQVTVLASEVLSLGMTYQEYLEDEFENGGTFEEPEDDTFYDPKRPALPEVKPPAHGVAVQRDVPAPSTETAFQIGDRVLMNGRTPGTIRYIKNGRYGVFFDHSKTTHYYDAKDLTAIVDAAPPVEEPDRADKADSEAPVRFDLNAPIITRETPARIMLQYWQGIAVNIEDEKTQQMLQWLMTMTPASAQELAEQDVLGEQLISAYEDITQVLINWVDDYIAPVLKQIAETAGLTFDQE